MDKESKKEVYETPEIEIIEFQFEDSIAASGTSGAGLFEEW